MFEKYIKMTKSMVIAEHLVNSNMGRLCIEKRWFKRRNGV